VSEGWRELLLRSSGSLTHYVRAAKQLTGGRTDNDFPRWALLPGEAWETAQSVIVRIEMPGISNEDIDVKVGRGRLRIRGEKRSAGEHTPRHYHLMERAFGRFERTIPLPCTVDTTRTEVSCQDGVVTVILAKTEEAPPRDGTVR
jgi:HSP20 family protein